MYELKTIDKYNPEDFSGYSYTFKGKGKNKRSVSNLVIMADTETSKEPYHFGPCENYIVAWTLSLMRGNEKVATYYGTEPETFVKLLTNIRNDIKADQFYIFFHNMPYDWWFLRQFMFTEFGYPEHQLNVKPHYPINIEFENGIVLRDSYIISQVSLEKWADELDVEDKKAVNHWDYNKIRNQGDPLSDDELLYIEHDTLAGVECLTKYCGTLGKTIAQLPYTATGLIRERFREVASKNRGHAWFQKQALTYEQLSLAEEIYHGGYTHMNRFHKGETIDEIYTNSNTVDCQDLASSYPWALISEKYPCEKFTKVDHATIDGILSQKDDYAFMFVATFIGIKLKDPLMPMPVLQASKARYIYDGVRDNGRILKANAVEIALTEMDLALIDKFYTYDKELSEVNDVYFAAKEYLPKWFTDFVFKLFTDKTNLKGGDKVLYAIKKALLNCCYGMCVQHPLKDDIIERYESGEYETEITRDEELYGKYCNSRNTFLPYQIGVWCTCYAMKNLFELGDCIGKDGEWLYSDTDSVFAYGWDKEKLNQYNEKRKNLLISRGYNGLEHNGRTYWLGIAELDKVCTEFRGLHSKCYAYRDTDKELHITVAGVPKKGVKCLHNDLNNFKVGFSFKGRYTGKLTHAYFCSTIHTDARGNRLGDSIDLSPCDYKITDPNTMDFEEFANREIGVESLF